MKVVNPRQEIMRSTQEEMPGAEQRPVSMQATPAFERFCSSVPFLPHRGGVKLPDRL